MVTGQSAEIMRDASHDGLERQQSRREDEEDSLKQEENDKKGSSDGGETPQQASQVEGKPEFESEAGAAGVARAEAFTKLLRSSKNGRIMLILLGVSLLLSMFAYALDQNLTSSFFSTIAASYFQSHSDIASINVASSIITAVSKPFIGKMSDITSRPTTYVVVLIFYCVGFIVAASAATFPAYVTGICFTAFSKSGLDLLSDIIVSDLTPLQWRQFFLAGLSSPYMVTVYIGGFVVSGILGDGTDSQGWRWGAGMFAIMMPVLLSPVILLLYYMQWKAQKLGMVSLSDTGARRKGLESKYSGMTYLQVIKRCAVEIDLVGLLLLAFAFALILLPFNLARNSRGGWSNPSMIAMLVVGFVILILFGLWEQFLAPIPMTPRRVLRNRAFLLAISVQVFSQLASGVESQYFSSYIYVTKQWTNYQWVAFVGTTTVGLCFWGIVNGLLQRRFHRFKSFLVFGGFCKILAYALLVETDTRSTVSTARLAIVQVLLGFGAFSVGGARIASQAAVAHRDLATVIFTVSLWSSLGSATGSAISSAIWTNRMVPFMVEELPDVPMATIRRIYGSIRVIRTYAPDDAIRQGAIRAYQRTNGILFTTAACLAILPFVMSFFIPNYYLDARHNLFTNKDLDGNVIASPARRPYDDEDANATGLKKLYYRIRRAWDC